ncbi:MAG: hypothetical protein MJE77_04830 [Proteobacteria bacterium]|nr:hypothetical protein [Pseudomonadota bacterium]
MHVNERIVRETAVKGLQSARRRAIRVDTAGWFAARQPGVIRFLEQRLQGDAFSVALHAAWVIAAAFEKNDGVPPPRLIRSLIERGESAIRAEQASSRAMRSGQVAIHSMSRAANPWIEPGCAERQPALVSWIAETVASPPIPLDKQEQRDVARCLIALVYGFDQLTTGRAVP